MQTMTPKSQGFYQPAEWDKHDSCWLAWPSHANLWQENLPSAQSEFTALCRAIGASEKLNILVPTSQDQATAAKALEGLPVKFHSIPFGDIWLRDTAPIFLKNKAGEKAVVRFGFNGWGGKYSLPHDDKVSSRVAEVVSLTTFSFPLFLEGGSVEVDGDGTCITTRQCLLNPNRNGEISEAIAEKFLCDGFGLDKVLWLGDGLINDHTDGHIDTLARFSSLGVVLCMTATESDDPNRDILDKIARDLSGFTDARGRKLKVIEVPSPGKILNSEDEIMPASYMNFYISNKTVIVPIYGSSHDKKAVEKIAECFPDRITVGIPAKGILSGGGAFHCITQQQPL